MLFLQEAETKIKGVHKPLDKSVQQDLSCLGRINLVNELANACHRDSLVWLLVALTGC